MEYVFGTRGSIEILKTKGATHSNLIGFHTVEQSYHSLTITDSFRVISKFDSKEDAAGNCYDWYKIDNHYRTIDKSESIISDLNQSKTDIEKNIADIVNVEDAVIENDINTSGRITEIEDALIELDEQINGGNENG